jgi:hypothetical protein
MRATRTLATVGLMIAASLTAVVPAASPAFAASCPDNGWSTRDGSTGYFFDGSGINIRTGPSTNCTSLGMGYSSQRVQYDCYKEGQDGTWTHLTDLSTGVKGWSKDSLLVGSGSGWHC